MLTKLRENDRQKCFKYWSSSLEMMCWTVETLEKRVDEHMVVTRKIKLTNKLSLSNEVILSFSCLLLLCSSIALFPFSFHSVCIVGALLNVRRYICCVA